MIDENFSKLHGLVQAWEGKEDQRVPADVITEMFNVHNQIFPNNREYSKSCGGCRQRVWNRLKAHYHSNKQSYGL